MNGNETLVTDGYRSDNPLYIQAHTIVIFLLQEYEA